MMARDPQMQLERYHPKISRRWHPRSDGGFVADLYEQHGIVHVFTYTGDPKHPAFTRLEMWIHPYLYSCRLPRHYHRRWLRRLGSQFDWLCAEAAKS